MQSPFSQDIYARFGAFPPHGANVRLKCPIDASYYIRRNAGCQIILPIDFVQFARITNLKYSYMGLLFPLPTGFLIFPPQRIRRFCANCKKMSCYNPVTKCNTIVSISPPAGTPRGGAVFGAPARGEDTALRTEKTGPAGQRRQDPPLPFREKCPGRKRIRGKFISWRTGERGGRP